MAQVINTNILSLTAQRNLNTSQGALATSLERLSSGLRINSAKDDAAGLAISERFSTQIRGLNQAIRNANDGISLAQTAEGALGELSSNLQRIRELAVQSVNATNSDTDRATLDQEVQQRLQEIDRIGSQTSFNGRNVLDGSFGSAVFQVGANVGETIGLNLETSVRTADIGATAQATSVDLSTIEGEPGSAASATFDLNTLLGTDFSGGGDAIDLTFGDPNDGTVTINIAADLSSGTAEDQSAALLSAINAGLDSTTPEFTAVEDGAGNITITDNAVASGFTAGDFTLTDADDALGGGTGSAVTPTSSETGVATVAAQPLTISDLTIQFGDSDPISITGGTFSTVDSFVNAVNTALGSNGTAILDSDTNTLSITSGEAITIGGSTDATAVFGVADGTTIGTSGSLDSVSVDSVAAANEAIQRIDAALTSASDLRSTFGAIQNRFESTIANLSGTQENLSASRSRIQDADFAAETAALTRAQILQQAGISVLSQANAQPQNVLALLN